MQSRPEWYQAASDDLCLDPAREAFTNAVSVFSTRLSKDPRKVAEIQKPTSINDVYDKVRQTQSRYDVSKQDHKVSKWLSKFSSRVKLYGNIMDVLVQHHPEYVSLAWGAMKLLFILVENHETMVLSLAKSLCKIGDALPRVELAAIIYPTRRMKQAVAELYANVIRFLLRAQDWYQENKLKHMLHSFTRPVELRYNELIEDIESCTRSIESLTHAASQVEQRDMHLELREVLKKQEEMRLMIIEYQSLNSSALLDNNQRLSDLQLSQIMTYTTSACKVDAMKCLDFNAAMKNKRQLKVPSVPDPFWLTKQFRKWNTATTSTLLMLKGEYRRRFEIRDFCVNVIHQLRNNAVPVLWVLRSMPLTDVEAPSVIDLLKDLVSQALRVNTNMHSERPMALSCTRFQTAQSESEWFDLLGSVLAGMQQVYIVVDLEAFGNCFPGSGNGSSWGPAFDAMFQKLTDRGLKTVVRVILVSYGSLVFDEMPIPNLHHAVLLSLKRPKKASQRPETGNLRSNRGRMNATRRPRKGAGVTKSLPLSMLPIN